MKVHRVVQMVGLTKESGRLASDMYDLNNKIYYSESTSEEIPISHMDFQHMVRAFVKLCDQENMLDRSEHMGTIRDLQERCNAKDDIMKSLHEKIEKLEAIIEEKDDLLDKQTANAEYWKNTYYNNQPKGCGYVFSEIPNDEYGKKLTRGMKVYLNDESYTMRVRGQHIKPELKGTGATYWGQSIEQSTHLRVYIDKKKGA